jgi:hypothetical protein
MGFKKRMVLFIFLIIIYFLNKIIQLWMLGSIIMGSKRALDIAVGYDRIGNIAMGQGNEKISSYYGRKHGWQERFIDWLFKTLTGEVGHCANSLALDITNPSNK